MTPYEITQLDQKRNQQQDAAALDRYAEGATDAGFGQPPQFADENYLAGYLSTLKHLPRNVEGRIIYASPRQHFAFGIVDSPDPDYGES